MTTLLRPFHPLGSASEQRNGMTQLLRYDAARRAIAEAKAVDEVKDIRDKADAVRIYARQAKDRAMEIDCAEIRFRAERRIGEIKAELKASGHLHEGGRPKKTDDNTSEVSKIKLHDLGVDESMSRRVDELLRIEPNSFDRLLARWRAYQENSTDRVSLDLLKEEREKRRKAAHAEQTFGGGRIDDLHALIAASRKFSAILADPPWHFVARSEKGEGRSASQHYTTDRTEADKIKALPLRELAAPDCTLFMWMVDWCPQLALDVIEAWGFAHKTTAFTWAKQNASGDGWHMGQGYWTRANPEDCWLATRGHPKRINADVRQLIVAPVMEHSRKPDETHARIERLVGGPYLELYARRERDNWVTWGNELEFKMPPHDPETGEIFENAALSDAGSPLSFWAEPLDVPQFLERRAEAAG
jgi:N6-adenosine-specific RNA methylase IME4